MKTFNKLALAISITAEAFKEKLDKGGNPYILHCLRVMNKVNSNDEDLMISAIMHDLIEDTHYTFAELTRLGFSDRVIGILHLLTHEKTTPYMEYIKAISVSEDATKIKLADLQDNSDITRLKGLRKKDMDRLEKYHLAYTYLSN